MTEDMTGRPDPTQGPVPQPTRSTDPLTPPPPPAPVPAGQAPYAAQGAPPQAAPGQQSWYNAAPAEQWYAAGAQTYPPLPHQAHRPPHRRVGAWVAAGAAGALVVGLTGFGAGLVVGDLTHRQRVQSSSAGTGNSGTDQSPFGQFGFGQSPFGSSQGQDGSSGSSTNGTGAPSDTAAIAKGINPAVVDVVTTFGYQRAAGAGTGIVLTSNGLILTNNHVIDGATSIKVTDVGNGRSYSATVLGYSATKDVALLQLKGASNLTTAVLGSSSSVKVGDGVVAVGNAGGKGGTPSVAGGSVTGLGRSITAGDELDGTSETLHGLIEVNAPIQAGDSGGPLVNASGQVIGIDTAAASTNGASGSSLGYAVPIEDALAIADQIRSGQGSSTVHVGGTAFLGVMVATNVRTSTGAPVASVVAGGAAAKAGLRAGDVITELGGKSVTSATRLSELMGTHQPGDKVTVRWVSATTGATQSATVTLPAGPPA